MLIDISYVLWNGYVKASQPSLVTSRELDETLHRYAVVTRHIIFLFRADDNRFLKQTEHAFPTMAERKVL